MTNNWRADSFANSISEIGTAQGDRHQQSGWNPASDRELDQDELDGIYEHSRFGRKIVERPAKDATRPEISITKGETEQEPLEKWIDDDNEAAINISTVLREAIILSRLTGGAAILLMVDDGRDLDQPIDWDNIRSLETVHVVDRWDISVDRYQDNLWDDNWRQPEMYWFHPVNVGASTGTNNHSSNILRASGQPFKTTDDDVAHIHADRVIRFEGESVRPVRKPDYNGWGQPTIEAAYASLKDIGIATQANATAIHEFQYQVLGIAGLMDIILHNENGEQRIKDRINMMSYSKSVMNAVALDSDRGETLEQRSVDFSGLVESYRVMQENLSADVGMPLSLLFGQTPSGLSTNDKTGRSNYQDLVADYRTDYMRPAIRKIVQVLLHAEQTPFEPTFAKKVAIQFGDLEQLTEQQEADIFEKKGGTISQLAGGAPVLGPNTASELLFSQIETLEDSTDEMGDRYDSNDVESLDDAISGTRLDKRSVWRPSPQVRENCRRGIKLRNTYGRGGTSYSQQLAKTMIAGVVDKEKAREVKRQLQSQQRHFDPEKTHPDDEGPTNGTITYLLYGGPEALEELIEEFGGRSDSHEIPVDPTDGKPQKQSKEDVGYQVPSQSPQEVCGNCEWYCPPEDGGARGGCGIVGGSIAVNGWCQLWGTKNIEKGGQTDE